MLLILSDLNYNLSQYENTHDIPLNHVVSLCKTTYINLTAPSDLVPNRRNKWRLPVPLPLKRIVNEIAPLITLIVPLDFDAMAYEVYWQHISTSYNDTFKITRNEQVLNSKMSNLQITFHCNCNFSQNYLSKY